MISINLFIFLIIFFAIFFEKFANSQGLKIFKKNKFFFRINRKFAFIRKF